MTLNLFSKNAIYSCSCSTGMQLQKSLSSLSLRPDHFCILISPLVLFLHHIKQKLLVFTCMACNDLFPPFFPLLFSSDISTHPSCLQVSMFSLQGLTFPFVLSLSFPWKHPIKLPFRLPLDPLSNSSLTFSFAGLSTDSLSTVKHLEC